MFIKGKKYIFSKRKYIKEMHLGSGRDKGLWIDQMIGTKFIADNVIDNGFTAMVYPHNSYMNYCISRTWCIEIK